MKGHAEKRLLMISEAVVVLLILLVINFLSTRFFARWDVTSDKLYTLAPASKEAVQNLPDVLNVEAFISSDVPPKMVSLVNDVRDLLSEFEAYADRNLRIRYYDPSLDTKIADKAKRLGIQELQVQVMTKDKLEVASAWLGIAIEYEDKKEIIPSIVSVQSLEYDLTSALVKVTMDKLPKIGILNLQAPQVQGTEQNRFNSLRQLLSSEFDVVSVNFDAEEKIPDDIDALFISDTWGITDFGKYLIDQYFMRGGKIIWFVDGITIGQGMQAYPSLPGIEEMMKGWGISLDRRLVLDDQSAMAGFRTNFGSLQMNYPCWVEIQPTNFARDFPVTSKLENVTLQWASPMKAEVPSNVPAEVQFTAEPVMFTSERAWLMQSPFNLDPMQQWASTNKVEPGKHPVAVYAKGIFPSFFAGKDVPEPVVPEAAEGEDPGLAPQVETPEKLEVSIDVGQILAVGCARFANDEFLPQFAPNQIFILNVADYFGYGNKLIGIRSRGETSRPVKTDLSPRTRNIYKYLNIFLMPVLLVLYGVLRHFLKRAGRGKIAAHYSSGGGK